jgi:hypothetical protein
VNSAEIKTVERSDEFQHSHTTFQERETVKFFPFFSVKKISQLAGDLLLQKNWKRSLF